MVDALGLLDGLTATGIILSSTIFALLSLYKSIKLKAKLLTFAALTMLFVGFLWLGPFIDFILVTFTGTNITPIYLYSLLSYLWVAPVLVFAMYLGGELLLPKKKWILVGAFIVLGIIFEYFLWFHTADSFTWTLIPGGLIDASFEIIYPTFILLVVFLISTFTFLGIGFAIKAKQCTGKLSSSKVPCCTKDY